MKKVYLLIILAVVTVLGASIGIYFEFRDIVVPVELTFEQQQDYEAKVKEYAKKIETEVDPEDKLKRPRLDDFVEKARYEMYLGRLSESIRTLLGAGELYSNPSVVLHNLAKIYERMGKFKKAIVMYDMLIHDNQLPEYWIDIAKAARSLGDVKQARDAYWTYQRRFKQPDAEFEQWMRDNKTW